MSIIIFIVVLIILILVHEFGHFITAKRFGVRVDEFGLGFPPRLFGIKRGETLYSINAIPFGGFVKIFGEDGSRELLQDFDKERSLVYQPKLVQGAIIAAGVLSNVLLGWVLISIGFMTGLPMATGSAPSGVTLQDVFITVTSVESLSPALDAGLMTGDKIVGLKTEEETLQETTIPAIQSFITAHGGEEISLAYVRGGSQYETKLVPVSGIIESKPAIGIAMDTVGIAKLSPPRALWEGGIFTVSLISSVIETFAHLIVDAFMGTADIKSLSGPIGIVGLVGNALEFGFVYLLSFVALISINLAVLNIIPFPALDGGRLLFLFIEKIKGSPINPMVANITHLVGFALLIFFMLVVSYNDVIKILN